jgi:hypothetical protein
MAYLPVIVDGVERTPRLDDAAAEAGGGKHKAKTAKQPHLLHHTLPEIRRRRYTG